MTIPLPGASIFPTRNAIRRPFKGALSGEKISMRVRGFAAWRIFFHLGVQDHYIEYRNTEQLRSNYSLAQSKTPEE